MRAHRVKGLDPAAPLGDAMARIVRVRCAELTGFRALASDPGEVQALHDMRIAAKRLRYVLELSEGCFGPYAATAGRRTKQLQDVLGEIHDCDVTVPRIVGLIEELRDEDVRWRASHSRGAPPNAPAYRGLEVLVVELRARRLRRFADFLEMWARLDREGFTTQLENALASGQDA